MERPGPHPASALGREQSQSRRISGSWLSASCCASYRSATKRNCRSQRRTSARGTYKLFGVVTNRGDAGDPVIWWLRERRGKSEEIHSVMKSDLAGGQLPSWLFGANAAWWALRILAHNLNTAMKRLVLGTGWLAKQMKALRLRLIGLPGLVSHATQADHPSWGRRRRAGFDHLGPSEHPGAGLRAVRMISRRRSHGVPGSAASHPIGRQCLSSPLIGHRTRGGCRPRNPNSPAVQPRPQRKAMRMPH